MDFKKKIYLFALLSLCATPIWSQQKMGKRPNVLFIAVDDLKPTISSWGDSYAITPNIDRLVARGTSFQNNHCQQALCAPTRASLLTGLRPDRTKVFDLSTNPRIVNPDMLSLPQHFKNNNYQTVAFGKIFHAAPIAVSPGHDAISWSIPYRSSKLPYYIGEVGRPPIQKTNVADNAYPDGENAELAMNMLEKLAKDDKPFFLAFGLVKPHLPFSVPKTYWDLYDDHKVPMPQITRKAINAPNLGYTTYGELRSYDGMPKTGDIPLDTQRELIKGYYASTTYTDAQIGKLLDKLKELKLEENTIIILWGDHGWHLGDHGQWTKHTNYEQATRSPLIICSPKQLIAQKVSSPTEFTDVFPTLCEMAGIPIPNNLDGKSLVPLIKDPSSAVHDFAVTQYPRDKKNAIMGYALRDNRYRLVLWMSDSYTTQMKYDERWLIASELYDYQASPNEDENLIDKPAYAETAKVLKAKLIQFFDEQYTKIHKTN